MTSKGFRQLHPVLSGFLILAGIFILFFGGIRLIIGSFSQPEKSEFFGQREGVGIISLQGMIVSPEETLNDLVRFRENNKVKAIVLRVDSPGGTVGASQEIFEEVKRTNKEKPIVASFGSVAASGGFYAALGAEKIIANPGTITGSVGVIIKFANLEDLFAKIGYRSEVIKSGKLKDLGSPSRALTVEERDVLQALIDNVHDQFIHAVAESRLLPLEKVRAMADGRIFSGEQAKEAGLIDAHGNFNDAILLAAELGNIETGSKMPRLIYPKRDKFQFLELLNSDGTDSLFNQIGLTFPGLFYEWALPKS